ncbi:MAG: SDR family NAD(P)-dependent oxidoreductase [Halobacteriota archaeon]
MSERVATITGADQPLGTAVATEVAPSVDALVLGGANVEALETVTEAVTPHVDHVGHLRTDVRDEFDIERLMETASRDGDGAISYVVPCARVHHLDVRRPLEDWSYAGFDDELRTNLRGVFTALREATPHCDASSVIAVPWVDPDEGLARPAEVAIESLVKVVDAVAAPSCVPVAVDAIPLDATADATTQAREVVEALTANG